jgi:DNA-binding NarL/FixJ family response regulator
MTDALRVAIIDPLPEIHAAIADLLCGVAGIRIVGHARSLREYANGADEPADVLVIDLRTCLGPERTLLDSLRAREGLRVVVTTSDAEPHYGEAALRLHADAWVPKARLAVELVRTLRGLAA